MGIASLIFGCLGTAFLVLSFQFRRVWLLFFCQMLSGLCFVLHYGLAGDFTGMCMDGMCFIRALMLASRKKCLSGKPAAAILCGVIVLLCVVTWEGVFSLFPTLALLASTLALFTGRGEIIRPTQLFCTSPAWLVYNFHVSSWPGVICETLDMGSVVVFCVRNFLRKKASKQ